MLVTYIENKIDSWSLVIADAIHNHLLIFFGARPIYWQFAYTDTIKNLIVFQIHIGASSKQVITAIWLGTNEKNPLIKPKDV